MTTFSAETVLAGLKDFQRASVEHAFRRLYVDDDSTRRFLIADETGLGKTMVAKGVIAKTIERLQDDDTIKRIDIIYICSNTDIAEQNLKKLAVYGGHRNAPANRLTMLVAEPDLLASDASAGDKPVTFVSFTPTTSFDLGGQTGKARERVILYRLLADHLELSTRDKAFKRVLQGGLGSIERFEEELASLDRDIQPGRKLASGGQRSTRWEPEIQRMFLGFFDSELRGQTDDLIAEIRTRGAGRPLSGELDSRVRTLVAELRLELARAGVQALEPDLVILDEFQRFKALLDPTNEASELATHLFEQPSARALLLSATPYKPFTFAEEATTGEDHYQDLFQTLGFIAGGVERTEGLKQHLAEFRDAALSGRSPSLIRDQLEQSMSKLMSRVERPSGESINTVLGCDEVSAKDLAGYVELHRLADLVDAPLSIEYWKSAPYFANFLDGYKVGEKVKVALKDPDLRHELLRQLKRTQRLNTDDVNADEPLDWGNARLRRLAADTVDQGWWKLLWLPPSLPYYSPGGPFAAPEVQSLTKRLVFSSWVAAPTAIASLLSREASRLTHTGQDVPARFTPRLQYRMRDDNVTPGAMTTLALFWPSPTIATAIDPLRLAQRTHDRRLDADEVMVLAETQARALVGVDGDTVGVTTVPWYSQALIGSDVGTPTAGAVITATDAELGGAFGFQDDESPDVGRALGAHLAEARAILSGTTLGDPASRPADLVETIALLGLASPGNVAFRSLQRLIPQGAEVTPLGLWRAAAHIADGFRALFNRPESTYLIGQLDPADDDAYWRSVLRYCRDGNLQAVFDEYLHHLAGAEGIEATSDAALFDLAGRARRALGIRGATYRGFDPDKPDRGEDRGLSFFSRFALRYGGLRQTAEDARLPEVRAAFNSPFWPFVLATTSIGQEGIDLHWWCHSVVHWNLPANPVDFEQREGRINRFKGHAIRKNIATTHRAAALSVGSTDVWPALFALAELDRPADSDEMFPFWIYPGQASVERHIMGFAMSRDLPAWDRLKDLLALYRLAYGQPRQDDMVELLARRGISSSEVVSLRLRLRPPVANGHAGPIQSVTAD